MFTIDFPSAFERVLRQPVSQDAPRPLAWAQKAEIGGRADEA
jgi:hypothetical protein